MGEATDAVREAIMRNKQLAAKHLVRKRELEVEVAKYQQERDDVANIAPPDLLAELDARIADRRTKLQAATYDYQQAMKELGELDRLTTQAIGGEARALAHSIHGDGVVRTNEQIALDNVREHIGNLVAGETLDRELADLEGPTVPARPPVAAEDADAAAKAEFEALRTKPPAKKTL